MPHRNFGESFKKGSGIVAGTAGHRPKVGRVLRTTVPDLFLNPRTNPTRRPFKSGKRQLKLTAVTIKLLSFNVSEWN